MLRRLIAGFGLVPLLLSLACTGGEGETAAKPAEKSEAQWYVSEFMGGVTRHWFPEEQVNFDNPGKSMIAYEVTAFPERTEPTPEQAQRAQELVRASFDAAQRHGWFNYEKGLADGFELMHSDPLHFAKREYVMDNEILNPEKPEFLMYYDTEKGKLLAGVMYLARTNEERGPQVGGPLTIWHYHVWDTPRCLDGELLVCGDPDPTRQCAEGEALLRSPEMMHVWLFNHPHGPFSSTMALPPEHIRVLAQRGF